MSPLVVAGSILLALILVALRNRGAQRVALAAAGLATLTLLVAPALWVEYTIAHANGNLVPSAGPQARGDFGGRPRFGSGRPFRFLGNNGLPPARPGAAPLGGPGFVSGGPPGGFVGRGGGPGGSDEATASPALVRYLENHQGRATFLVGTLNAAAAEPFILSTGKPVMDLGGFMGADRILDPQQLAGDVSHGLVRYFLLPGFRGIPGALPARVRVYLDRNGGFNPRFPGAFGGERNANSDLVRWVSTNCTSVPSQAYGVVTASGLIGFGDRGGANQLYDCGRYAAGHKS
jgi:hypothetical protein